MISLLRGKILERANTTITLDVSGVGYEIYCSEQCLQSIELANQEEEVSIIIFTDVKEDSITLYGFSSQLEKRVFLLLKTVKGVGSRMASFILSTTDTLELLRAIGSGDSVALQSLKGVGKKTAERIIVELKEKVTEYALSEKSVSHKIEVSTATPHNDALLGLQSLGFSVNDAEKALSQVPQELMANGDSAVIIKEALRYV